MLQYGCVWAMVAIVRHALTPLLYSIFHGGITDIGGDIISAENFATVWGFTLLLDV